MKNYKNIFIALGLLVGFVTACGNNPPVSLATLPVYQQPAETPEPVAEGTPTPTPPAPLEEITQDKLKKPVQNLLQGLESAAETERMDLAIKTFPLPNAITWEEVKSFYTSNLGREWKENNNLNFDVKKEDSEIQLFTTTGWINKAPDKEQVFVVGIIVDQEEKKFLVMALFTEK